MNALLVLVPGLGADAGERAKQIDCLVDVAELTVADLGPCGSRTQMAEAILSAASGPFALAAGHSMGGWAAQEAAARAPHCVTRLALLNTWARPDPAAIVAQRRANRHDQSGAF
jgi:pimeloyl-ACP methyl ester carboxylesterase